LSKSSELASRAAKSAQATSGGQGYRGAGLAGDYQAGINALKWFVVIVRETRPILIQFFVALFAAGLMGVRAALWGLSFHSVIAVIIVHGVGLIIETNNSVHERNGNAIAELVAYIRATDPTAFDAELDKPPTHNRLTATIKEGGAATVSPAFFLALIVDVLILIFG
jgi:hypothetical protein